MKKGKKIGILVAGLLLGTLLMAQDAQWRGPGRDGIFPAANLMKLWPDEGPEKIFVAEGLGKSYSSVSVWDGRIFTTGILDTLEYLSALDMDGKILWQKAIGPAWNKSFPEARATPTIEGKRVYVLSGRDLLACFNTEDGSEIWSVDLHREYQSSWDMFGVSESVLLVGDKVITTPMGKEVSAIALDKMTGELIWKSGPRELNRSNMSPILIEHCGKAYVIAAGQTHLMSIDPDDGKLMWEYHYNHLLNGDNQTILANTPLYQDSCLWISNGWDISSVMLEIAPDGRSVSEKFRDQTFDNQNHGQVLVDGFVYGSNFTGRNSGKWVCMNWDSGEIVWIGDFHNKGPLIFADGMLYLLDEKRGNIGLAAADPKKFELISSFRVTDGKGPFWSRPAIYEGRLFIRHGESLIAYDISL